MSHDITPQRVLQAVSLCELFQETVASHRDAVALRSSGGEVVLTWGEYDARVRKVAAGLAALGVGRGDTVAIMMANRPEFHVVDAAAMHLGATSFSLYNTATVDQIAYQFSNAENKIVVCEETYLATVTEAAVGSKVEHLVALDGGPAGATTLEELEAIGDAGFDFDAAWQAIEPDDVLTLIYTSGTTGPPKGVELTHGNILFNIGAALEIPEFLAAATDGRVASYLPDAHIVNRWAAHYMPAVVGTTVTTVADPKTLLQALTTVRPTFFVAVPMLWYKLKAAIEAGIAAEDAETRQVIQRALELGLIRARQEAAGEAMPADLAEEYARARSTVLSKLAAKVGLDEVVMGFSGAAPIAAEALEFVLSLGIPVCEGWGMSELSAVATLNRPGSIRPGTVGQALTGVELVLADDGELLARGPGVMKGYRNDPQKTAEAIDGDGWMHTGDIATIEDGVVRIVDRKKEIIINSAGKNLSPANIENSIKVACPLVGSAVAIGDQRKYVTALIVLDPDVAAAFAAAQGFVASSAAALAEHPAVRKAVEAGVAAANAVLARVEQVKDFTILPNFWEVGGDELTPTMKLKRRPIADKYAVQIDALYQV